MTRKLFYIVLLSLLSMAVEAQKDSTKVYKKRVLENAEVDLLMSYYKQDGDHSVVGGGVGSEKLNDVTPTIVITVPLNDDDVLTIDTGLSAYTSASSSNINPFNSSGASRKGRDDDDGEYNSGNTSGKVSGSPWIASSGASRKDVLYSLNTAYSHSSDDRNLIWGPHVSFSNEFDYTSFGFGGSVAKLFNEKNTELSLKGQVYLDVWRPIYPTELHEYSQYGIDFLTSGYFSDVPVIDQSGNETSLYKPERFSTVSGRNRNSYSASFGFSQILSKRLQASVFMDLVYQKGLLSTPYHRIYFADKPSYYIGVAGDIPNYTSSTNTGAYRLADDIERMPDNRFKIPVGARVNYYLNEFVKLRSYYRYYTDDWGITSHTASLEIPVKLTQRFTLTPTYRFYTQTAADYFAPYASHLSTEKYYTSDYDLSAFHSHQYGLGISYTDVFTKFKVYKFGLKNIDLRFNHYDRSDGLKANIVSLGIKFIFD